MLYCETLVDDIGQRGVLVMQVKSIFPTLLALLLTVSAAALANSEWGNLAEDQRVYAEFVLGPGSKKELMIYANTEIKVSIFAKLVSPSSEDSFYEYARTNETPIEMVPLAKEGWPVATSLGGGGTRYAPIDGKISLRINNHSPVELKIAIAVPK